MDEDILKLFIGLFFLIFVIFGGIITCNVKTDEEKISSIIKRQEQTVEYYHTMYLEEKAKLDNLKLIVQD